MKGLFDFERCGNVYINIVVKRIYNLLELNCLSVGVGYRGRCSGDFYKFS